MDVEPYTALGWRCRSSRATWGILRRLSSWRVAFVVEPGRVVTKTRDGQVVAKPRIMPAGSRGFVAADQRLTAAIRNGTRHDTPSIRSHLEVINSSIRVYRTIRGYWLRVARWGSADDRHSQ